MAFDAEYYGKLLASLTINSRAVITELTTLAEENVGDAPLVVQMVEERIRKALPQHKLFAMYLMDSISKNVGPPYPMLFAKNMFKVFTATYTSVPDTSTRQNLINLFKTWMLVRGASGQTIFPLDTLQKIETFIIQATSIQGQGAGMASAIPAGAAQGVSRVTQDMLIREGRGLLYRSIQVMKSVDRLGATDDDFTDDERHLIHKLELERNRLVGEANEFIDTIVDTLRPDQQQQQIFEKNYKAWTERLNQIKGLIDKQAEQLAPVIERVSAVITTKRQQQEADQRHQKLIERRRQYLKDNKPEIDPIIKVEFFSDVFSPTAPPLITALATVGMPVVKHAEVEDVNPLILSPTPDVSLPEPTTTDYMVTDPEAAAADTPTGGLLGFSMSSFDSDDDENDDNSPQHLSANSSAVDLPAMVTTTETATTETATTETATAEEAEAPIETTEATDANEAVAVELVSPEPINTIDDVSSGSDSEVEIKLHSAPLRSPPPSSSAAPTFADDDDDDDAYEPEGIEWTPPGSPVDATPAPAAGRLRSSLKRRSPDDPEPRTLKRVRFAI
ncbi:hypothetical protein DIURU_003765 [Diutina rugosa]|uniref:CID domain-containing protein n=1 Tax=Diutina rugosa TaxID=5481 RepID=A0A642UJX2_DIURU|nr:uncharacterized protein DIURU_003765 [Diutina rugosa]KAA8900467.1 hypothetical protein DIURU_003765 [Diutina rugosa]